MPARSLPISGYLSNSTVFDDWVGMEEEEVERLVAELRETLHQTGFGWAAEQAERALPTDAAGRIVAHALLDAVEAVTTKDRTGP